MNDTDLGTRRLGAFGALGFSLLVIVQNVVRGATVPPGRPTDAQLLEHLRHNAWTQSLFSVTFALGLVCLLLFASAVSTHADRGSARTRMFARFGMLGVVAVGVDFLVLNAVLVAMFTGGEALASQAVLARALWDVHTGVFALNAAAIAVALLGLSFASVELGWAPRFVRPLGIVGSLLLLVGAMPAMPVVSGSAIIGVGIAGFGCWVVFLIASGVRMLRA